ncbi:tRNA-intron lyase [Candidatus Woesearchaeota archaeon CG10_big_fil_rev_8_21_14_0_10_30_7]|nr:MAG: tRNA-intron lyase [Candidatus Woesearchaeota archaeon CG10_big_fil_rev_8_21_14_0_10_30_7]
MAKKSVIKAVFDGDKVITENSDEARELYNQSRYGALLNTERVKLSFLESYYLLEKERLEIYTETNKLILLSTFLKKIKKKEPRFVVRYAVYKDIRDRGYIIKTALKFGADFRVYNRGVKPGEDHAKWVVFAVQEGETYTWHEFSAKNRVAHSTRKKLLLGIVDDEGDVSYWECRWLKP